MNKGFFTKLAITNIKNNLKLFMPYILMNIGIITLFFIMNAISQNPGLMEMSGGRDLKLILVFGNYVIGIFSLVFIFYTNSFLAKRRKKEIGLYNILGMGKKHLGIMMFIETIFIAVLCLVAGILSGVVLSKLMFLVMLKIIAFSVPIAFTITIGTITLTITFFSAVFIVTLFYNLAHIHLSNPIELLKGSQVGEREPKTKWFMTLIGLVTLGAGYYLAQSVEAPLQAMQVFFIAVVLVMIGTYLLFTTGSITALKGLKKNKTFYYQSKNFISVSGMIYRMKQNAIGLSNICILSTAVLVTLSTTFSLYVGLEDVLKERYPQDVIITAYDFEQTNRDAIDLIVDETSKKYDVTLEDLKSYTSISLFISKEKDAFNVSNDYMNELGYMFTLVSVADYNAMYGDNRSLEEDEILLYTASENYGFTELKLNGDTFKVVDELDTFADIKKKKNAIVNEYYLIVKDAEAFYSKYENFENDTMSFIYQFNLPNDFENQYAFETDLEASVNRNLTAAHMESRLLSKQGFFQLYGGMFFIGIFLGTLFLMATVMIIYYKQVSEGYDDKSRFEIMQKVGMSVPEIKRSIKAQIIMVFFLPLLFAMIHIGFAFKVITKLLAVFNFYNIPLFFLCTVGTIFTFAIIYMVVYFFTAKAYYKIVK